LKEKINCFFQKNNGRILNQIAKIYYYKIVYRLGYRGGESYLIVVLIFIFL